MDTRDLHEESPGLNVTPEETRPANEDTKPVNSGADTRGKREAATALREALDQSVARITGHLKAAGATEEELRAARPGLISATLALGPVESILAYVGMFTMMAVPAAYIGLADIPEFVQRGGFLLYPLFWTSGWNHALARASGYVFWIGGIFGALLLVIYDNPLTAMRVLSGPTLAQQAARQSRRLAIVYSLRTWLFIPSVLGALVAIGFLGRSSISALSLGRGPTWWDGILVVLSSIWSLFIWAFLFRRVPGLLDALQNYRFPGFALVKALSEALDAVRDQHLWFDVEHRLLVARELAKAADILDGPMLQRFVRETGGRGAAVLAPRLSSNAAALRRKLTWVATPMSETREDLEHFLRAAVIAAATGQIDRIGSGEATELEAAGTQPRVLITRLIAFAKGLLIAAIPLGLVWVALKFGFVDLSSAADRTAAQNAAMLWFVLSILRALDPSGFKDVSDASGGWTERFSRSLGRGSR